MPRSPASPVLPFLRRHPQPGKRTKRAGLEHTPPLLSPTGRRAGPARSGRLAGTAHAWSRGGAGPGAAGAHARTSRWLCKVGDQAVAALRSCASGSPRGPSPRARRVRDPGAEHSRGHRWRCGSGSRGSRLLVLASAPPSGPLGRSATPGTEMWARASGSVGGRVFCVACAPSQVGSSRPAVTIPRAQDLELWFPRPNVGPPSSTNSIPST